jgi:hypothetical protein
MITRLLMAVPVVGVAAVSPVEAGTPDDRRADDELAIARVEQIRHQLRVHDDEVACSERRQFAQWYNFPNWPNWKNWNDWDNRRDSERGRGR